MDSHLIEKVAVVGLGNFGTAMAHWLAHNFRVSGWTRSQETANEINNDHTNEKYLPNYSLHHNLQASTSLTDVVEGAPVIMLCLHARYIPELVVPMLGPLQNRSLVINTSKGMLFDPGITVYDYLAQAFRGKAEVLHLAGPLVANEFSRGASSVAILSRPHTASRDTLALLFYGTPISLTFSTDVQGLLWGSILKNIYAIGSGVLEVAARENINLKGIYITKAYEEMLRFIQDKGGYAETAGSLAGLGDLMATSLSAYSNNHRYGVDLANAKIDSQHFDIETGPEGIYALRTLAKVEGEDLARYPIMHGLWRVINNKVGIGEWMYGIAERMLGADKRVVEFGDGDRW